jgi:hypothetical protein
MSNHAPQTGMDFIQHRQIIEALEAQTKEITRIHTLISRVVFYSALASIFVMMARCAAN